MTKVQLYLIDLKSNKFMSKIQEIERIILKLENSQEYLEGKNITEMIYPLQKLSYEDWEILLNHINTWNTLQRTILVEGILQIGDNKISNYDTSKIFAKTIILSEQTELESLIQYFIFLDNKIPKEIQLINQLFEKVEWLESRNMSYEIDFEKIYKLIDKLYVEAYVN